MGTECAGLPLGVERDQTFEAIHLQLAPGDSLTLFTDGFSEAMNPKRQQYGLEHLRERLADEVPSAREVGQHILDDVTRHVQGHPQSDDMCLVCVFREGVEG